MCFNLFPTYNNFAADDFEKIYSRYGKSLKNHCKKVESIVAKGAIARFEEIFLLSQSFQTSSAADASRCVYRLERVNPFPHMTIMQQTTLNIFCKKIEHLYN